MPLNDITMSPAWRTLQELVSHSKSLALDTLFGADPDRFSHFSCKGPDLLLDFSKNHVNSAVIAALIELARDAGLPDAIEAMFRGDRINTTEDRAAMHFALRASAEAGGSMAGDEIAATVRTTRERVARLGEEIRAGRWLGATGKSIRSVIHIGIGGSALGPRMVMQALRTYQSPGIECHFVSNIDGEELAGVTAQCNAEETLVIVVSKSFTTLETRVNGESARRWLTRNGVPESDVSRHLVAVTANVEAAAAFGVPGEQVFPMWDWVGGRYSLWSAVGLVLSIALGGEVVAELAEGGAAMDDHFQHAMLEENLPALLALIGIWYINFRNAPSLAVIPYSHRLNLLPDYLQQLEMESNGKSVTRNGTAMMTATAPILWGGEGTNSQHSFHQLLLQGSRAVPVDFILPLTAPGVDPAHQEWLVANCLSQSRALMVGRDLTSAVAELVEQGMDRTSAQKAAPHRVIAGNRPSTTIVMEELTPRSLGALIALYEHKVFTQGVIWNINSFDQWGVELGKRIAGEIHDAISEQPQTGSPTAAPHAASLRLDSSTRGLVDLYKSTYNSNKK